MSLSPRALLEPCCPLCPCRTPAPSMATAKPAARPPSAPSALLDTCWARTVSRAPKPLRFPAVASQTVTRTVLTPTRIMYVWGLSEGLTVLAGAGCNLQVLGDRGWYRSWPLAASFVTRLVCGACSCFVRLRGDHHSVPSFTTRTRQTTRWTASVKSKPPLRRPPPPTTTPPRPRLERQVLRNKQTLCHSSAIFAKLCQLATLS